MDSEEVGEDVSFVLGYAGAMVTFVRIPSWWNRRSAHPENVMSPLDIGYAISLLERRGVQAHLIDIEATNASPEAVRRTLLDQAPDTVVLHAITPAVPDALALARFVKDRIPSTRKVVLVGQHASVLPASVLGPASPIDLCIRGEFERKIVEVATAPDFDATGTATAQQVSETVLELEDLDRLPFPSHELFRSPRYRVFHPTGIRRRWKWGFILSSRGCPHSCVYCSPTLRNSFGSRYRARSFGNVVAELRHLQDLGFTVVHFKDDLFTLHKERIHELCEAILSAGLRLPWTAQTRPDAVDEPLLRAMKRAGCRTLGMGVETGSARMVQQLRKGNRIDDVRNAFRWARAAGLRTVAFFILGSPGETEADVSETYQLMREIEPSMIQVAFFTPYPGSAAWDASLSASHDPTAFSHYNAVVNLSGIPTDRLQRLQRNFYLDFLTRTGFVREYARSEWLPALINADKFLPFLKLSASFLMRR